MPRPLLLTVNGTRYCTREIAELTGLTIPVINARLKAGWTVEQAVGTPTPKQRRRGVVSNLGAFNRTGGGKSEQETSQIGFHEASQ